MKKFGIKNAIRFMSVVLAVTAVCGTLCLQTFGSSDINSEEENPVLTCTLAQEWNDLFSRKGMTNTWLGADGIYSVSLDGDDSMGSAADTDETARKTFFIFSDTIIGTSNSDGKVTTFLEMPNQTSAIMTGTDPSHATLDFYYGYKATNSVSSNKNLFGVNEWMFDCFVLNGSVHVFGFTQQNWKPASIDLFSLPITESGVDYQKFTRKRVIRQLLYTDSNFSYAYGMGILNNTEAAHAPNADGYIYIYGYRDNFNNFSQKDLIVSRISATDFPDFTKLRYWNGTDWCDDIEQSAILIERVSCETSISPVTSGPYAGKYIAVYTNNVQSANMMYSIGDSPTGPFSAPVEFYTAPETGVACTVGSGTLYTYNAKAHPNLSDERYLLVSYNVNANNGSTAKHTNDYIPRFLYLDLWAGGDYKTVDTSSTSIVTSSESSPETTPATSPVTSPVTSSAAVSDTDVQTGNSENNKTADIGRYLPVALVGAVAIGGIIGAYISIQRKKKNL